MSQKFIRENEILLSKDGRNYKLTLVFESKEKITLRVEEENSSQRIPPFYERAYTIDQLPKKNDDIITINNMQAVLRGINSSSKNNHLDFDITAKYVKLFYVLAEEKKEVSIPFGYKVEDDNFIFKLYSGYSQTTKKLNEYLKKKNFWQRGLVK